VSDALVIATAAAFVAWLVAGATVVRLASRFWLRHWAERGLRGVTVPLGSAARPQRLLTSATVTVALVLALAGAVLAATPGVTGRHLVASLVACAVVVLFVAQLLARAVARHSSASLASWTLPVLQLAEVLASPVLAAMRVLRRAGPIAPRHAAEERFAVQRLLREAELEGVAARDDATIITGVVEFGDKQVKDVMTPRGEVFAVSDALPVDEAASRVAQSAYSRVPVYHETLDRVTGMIHAFDLLRGAEEALAAPRPVATAVQDARCSDLLFRMLRDHRHLAIVHDGNGHTVGIVTLEDLLEELVGDIRDEHDEPAATTV
jgi:putative hemolysin